MPNVSWFLPVENLPDGTKFGAWVPRWQPSWNKKWAQKDWQITSRAKNKGREASSGPKIFQKMRTNNRKQIDTKCFLFFMLEKTPKWPASRCLGAHMALSWNKKWVQKDWQVTTKAKNKSREASSGPKMSQTVGAKDRKQIDAKCFLGFLWPETWSLGAHMALSWSNKWVQKDWKTWAPMSHHLCMHSWSLPVGKKITEMLQEHKNQQISKRIRGRPLNKKRNRGQNSTKVKEK